MDALFRIKQQRFRERAYIYKDIKKFLTVNKISIDIKKILSP